MTDTIQPGQWVRHPDPKSKWKLLVSADPWPVNPDHVLLVFHNGDRSPSHTKFLTVFAENGERCWEVSDTEPESGVQNDPTTFTHSGTLVHLADRVADGERWVEAIFDKPEGDSLHNIPVEAYELLRVALTPGAEVSVTFASGVARIFEVTAGDHRWSHPDGVDVARGFQKAHNVRGAAVRRRSDHTSPFFRTRIVVGADALAAVARGEVLFDCLGVIDRESESSHPYLIAAQDRADAAYGWARFFTEEPTTDPEGNMRPRFSGAPCVILLSPEDVAAIGRDSTVTVDVVHGKTRDVMGSMPLHLVDGPLVVKTEYGPLKARSVLVEDLREGDLYIRCSVLRAPDKYLVFRSGLDYRANPDRYAFSRGTVPGVDWPAGVDAPEDAYSADGMVDLGGKVPPATQVLVIDDQGDLRRRLTEGDVPSRKPSATAKG